jgi:hypothetical protein
MREQWNSQSPSTLSSQLHPPPFIVYSNKKRKKYGLKKKKRSLEANVVLKCGAVEAEELGQRKFNSKKSTSAIQ